MSEQECQRIKEATRRGVLIAYEALVSVYHKADAEYEAHQNDEDVADIYYDTLCDAILKMENYRVRHNITRDELTALHSGKRATSVADCVRMMTEALGGNKR